MSGNGKYTDEVDDLAARAAKVLSGLGIDTGIKIEPEETDRSKWMEEPPPGRVYYASSECGGEGGCGEQADEPAFDENAWNEVVSRLAKYSAARYQRVRKDEAKRFGMPVAFLDKQVAAARDGRCDESLQGKELILTAYEPWPEPVDGAELLSDLADYFSRHVLLPDGAPFALALWTVHTYVYAKFAISPKLHIRAPTRDSGKTRLLWLVGDVSARPLKTANISTSALFRVIQKVSPTLLWDEIDGIFKGPDGGDKNELISILNASHEQDGHVVRSVGDTHEPRMFGVYTPMALAGIGTLPGALASRAIEVPLRRAMRHEVPRRPTRATKDLAELLSRRCLRWANDNADRMDPDADPETWKATEAFNRHGDNWRPLCAIADLAGGIWPKLTLVAVKALSPPDDDTDSLPVKLLHDLQAVWPRSALDAQRLQEEATSADLADALVDLEGRPWAELGKARKPLTTNRMATMLEAFKVRPVRIGPKDARRRGYLLEDLADAFGRHPKP